MRLTASLWVSAYLTRLRLADIPAFVTTHGDDTGGSVLVKLNTLDGNANAFVRSFDLATGNRAWLELSKGLEREVDASIEKQVSRDPDLWVIEVEARNGRHLLNEPGLSE